MQGVNDGRSRFQARRVSKSYREHGFKHYCHKRVYQENFFSVSRLDLPLCFRVQFKVGSRLDIDTKDGISLLSLKHHLMLSYLQSLTLTSAHRVLGHNISDRSSSTRQPFNKVERRIHDVFYDRVTERPDTEAVCAWDGSFTYRELNSWADKLARRLVELGVWPESLVPLCFDKSVSANTA